MGRDSFTYTIKDGHGHLASAQVVIAVAKVKVDLELRQAGKLTPAPENGAHQTMVNFSGTDQLGPLMGIKDLPDDYLCQIEVVGTVHPAEAANFEYDWEATVQERYWQITSDGVKWIVTKPDIGGEAGIPDPKDDGPNEEYCGTTPDPKTRRIFMMDTSGVGLVGFGGPGADVQYVRIEKNFVFRVYVVVGGDRKQAGVLKQYQTITAHRVANTGVIANDWQGIQNDYTQGATDLEIKETEVRDLVGGNLPIDIDDNANRANPENEE